MLRPRSLRTRLIIAAGGSILAAVILFGIATVLLVRHELRGSLDSALRQRAQDVAQLAVSAPAVLTDPGALESTASGRELVVQVIDSRGRIVARSLTLGAKLLPQDSLDPAHDRQRAAAGSRTSRSAASRSGCTPPRSPRPAARRRAARCSSPRTPPTSRTRCMHLRGVLSLTGARRGTAGGAGGRAADPARAAPAASGWPGRRGRSSGPPIRPGGCPRPPRPTRSASSPGCSTGCWRRWSARGRPSGGSSPTPRTSCARRSPRCSGTSTTRPATGPTPRCSLTSSATPSGWRGWSTTCWCSSARVGAARSPSRSSSTASSARWPRAIPTGA